MKRRNGDGGNMQRHTKVYIYIPPTFNTQNTAPTDHD